MTVKRMQTNLFSLLGMVKDSSDKDLDWFLGFAEEFICFTQFGTSNHPNIQADIVSTNEPNYHFIQYSGNGNNITRPINADLFLTPSTYKKEFAMFRKSIASIKSIKEDSVARINLNKVLYTCQQSVACTFDASGDANEARKRNGGYFEMLIKSVIKHCGLNVNDNNIALNLPKSNEKMNFERDVVLLNEHNEEKAVGQLKTTSKDRIDKVFLDRFMYNKLMGKEIVHFAIFLNDVQRNKGKVRFDNNQNSLYGINSTFLPGHFKAYSIAFSPLDGVYYLDIRPNMKNDAYLSKHIHTFDKFLVEDMWSFVQ